MSNGKTIIYESEIEKNKYAYYTSLKNTHTDTHTDITVENKYKKEFIKIKKERREQKRSLKRNATADEVIFIFERILEGWKTIRIYNTLVQKNQSTNVDKKWVERIATGNCKLYESELPSEKYKYYIELREKIYKYHNK